MRLGFPSALGTTTLLVTAQTARGPQGPIPTRFLLACPDGESGTQGQEKRSVRGWRAPSGLWQLLHCLLAAKSHRCRPKEPPSSLELTTAAVEMLRPCAPACRRSCLARGSPALAGLPPFIP